jgi:tetratricopeptide (TPR) repeat protein
MPLNSANAGFRFSQPQPQQLSMDQALTLAGQLQGQGKLAEAEHWLRQILQMQPNHASALHLLGVVAYQAGNLVAAAELMKRAIGATLTPTLSHREREQSTLRVPDPTLALFHANLCEVLRRLKRLDEAVAHGKRAVELDPALAMAHSNLGIAYFEQKEYDNAEASQQRALALQPNFAPSLNNLGSIYRERGDKKAALEWYAQAATANPNYLEPLNNLGALLLEEDRIPEATESLQKALRLNPNYAEAICNMGGILLAQEDNDAALANFKRALALRPVYLEAQMGLSKTLQALEALEDAEVAAQRALQIDGNSPNAHAVLGSIYSETSHPAEAEQEFKRALEIDPKSDEGLLGLGHLCVENGEQERAEELFERALLNKPDNISARIHLIQARKVTPGDENFAALLEEENSAGHSDHRKMSLHFALGKCYDDTKDYDKAFLHFLEGCKLKRAKFKYDVETTARQFTELTEIFSQAFIDKLRGSGDPSALPIFVLGMPRSGTTLTEQTIASHPDVYGAGELPDLLRIAHRRTDVAINSFPDNLRYLNPASLSAWGAEYIVGLKQRAPKAKHITDKMPANFFAVPLIHLMLPNAKIIHVNRNPVDTCLSCFTRLFNRKQEHTYDLAELGRYYTDYARLMEHWREVLPPGTFYDVQYENIVANQESEARKLLAYCGLEWDAACLDFHKTKRQVRTASVTQVRQPIYTTSVERWRKYEKFLGPLLEQLGELVPKR